MIVSTLETAPGHEIIEVLGIVRGSTVRARHLGHDILANLRNIVGGEVNDYTKMLAEAREQAMDRMIAEANRVGADGVLEMRFMTSSVMQGAAEIVAYGTAVRLRPIE